MNAGPAPFDAPALLAEGTRLAGRDPDTVRAEAAHAGWVDAFGRLVQSARDEGGFHEAGAAAFAAKLAAFVAERLRAEDWLAEVPGVRDRPLPVRFVVAGLGRSGTTLLHRLLACDPNVEVLPTWQAFHPVPPRTGPDTRRADTVAMIDALRAASPESFRIHPLDADAPEEEVFLLQQSFASMLFVLSAPLPGYNAWLGSTDHHDAYRFALDLLRLNEWHAGVPEGRPRVMKSPQFVLDLAVVTDLVPGAVIAQTHRDPVDLVGSYCSTYEQSRRRGCRAVDPVALGRERLDQLAAMLARSGARLAAATRAGHGARFVDVQYDRLVTQPRLVVEELYAAAGLTPGAATARAIDRWLAENPQNRAGRREYDLASYGLDRAAVEAALAAPRPAHGPSKEDAR